jgi:hypothetical protein
MIGKKLINNSCKWRVLPLLALMLFVCVKEGFPQEKWKATFREENNCESNTVDISYILSFLDKDKSIIAIARLGDGETSSRYNLRRLKSMKDSLSHSISRERIVTAQGERIKGRGRVEIYLDGRLFIVFTVGRNQDLHIGNCADG